MISVLKPVGQTEYQDQNRHVDLVGEEGSCHVAPV